MEGAPTTPGAAPAKRSKNKSPEKKDSFMPDLD